MSDSSRYNSPSRKSRFRAQGRTPPIAYTHEEGATQAIPAEEIVAGNEAGGLHESTEIPAEDPASYALSDDPAAQAYDAEPLTDEAATYAETAGDYADSEANDDHIPAGLRLTRPSDSLLPIRRGPSTGGVVLIIAASLAVGGLAGYLLGNTQGRTAGLRAGQKYAESVKVAPTAAISDEDQAAVDAGFTLTKQGKYAEARQAFEALYKKHPEWWSMEIEAARASLYQRDFPETTALLGRAARERPLADAALLSALVHLTAQEFDAADTSFAAAVATDPARADIYYFWGENLRREGKPLEAAAKFKAALLRNQYENVEGLYQLKYWLSLVQADLDGSSGEGAKIDAVLATAHPTGAALFAGAGRAIKAGQFKEAGEFITRARAITDPAVFRVILSDPTFMEANLRPEMVGFYR